MIVCPQSSFLNLQETIPLPAVKGRIDHMSIDVTGKRLFVAALGNSSLEVIDLQSGKGIHSVKGLQEPQDVKWIPSKREIVVTSAGEGSVRFYDANSFRLLKRIDVGHDADNLRYVESEGEILVGYGSGGLCIVDPRERKRVTDIRLNGHPESFQLDDRSGRIFVNVPESNEITVIDQTSRKVAATVSLDSVRSNFPMVVDPDGRCVYVGCRDPSRLLFLDADSVRVLGSIPLCGDVDDMFIDRRRRLLYASCGEGFIEIFAVSQSRHVERKERLATSPGARTSLFVPELDRLFLAVPRRGALTAEIRVYAFSVH